jgi:hypothetical protein
MSDLHVLLECDTAGIVVKCLDNLTEDDFMEPGTRVRIELYDENGTAIFKEGVIKEFL